MAVGDDADDLEVLRSGSPRVNCWPIGSSPGHSVCAARAEMTAGTDARDSGRARRWLRPFAIGIDSVRK